MSDIRTILFVDDHEVMHLAIPGIVFRAARLLIASTRLDVTVPPAQQREFTVVYGDSKCKVSEAVIGEDSASSITYRVISATTAATALNVLNSEVVDTVLLDLFLDSDQIWPAVEIAKLAASKNARVCVLTGDDATTSVALLHGAGVCGFMTKHSPTLTLGIGWLLDGNSLFPASLLDGAETLRTQAEFISDDKNNAVLLDLLHKIPQKSTADKVGMSQAWVSNKIEEAMMAFGTEERSSLLRSYLLAKMPDGYRLAILEALTTDSHTLDEVAKRHNHNSATLRQKVAEYYSAINVSGRDDARQLLNRHGL